MFPEKSAMLVSHKHKFIFIKTKKTAGTSIEEYLSRFCEKDFSYYRNRFRKSHLPAEQIRVLVGKDVWDSYVKICPIRNPWDLTVSLYFWRARKRTIKQRLRNYLKGRNGRHFAQRESFDQYVRHLSRRKKLNVNRHIVYINGQLPDYSFVRYESLEADFRKILERLGLPFDKKQLSKRKSSFRKERSVQSFYDAPTASLVERAYDVENKDFGYSFPDA